MARRHPLPSPAGTIRVLSPRDLPLFREHLLRLDASSRRDRFNGVTDDRFVMSYAARCFDKRALVIGYFAGGTMRGAAELHERADAPKKSAEIAFSVERSLQHRGIGSRLFERLIERAVALGHVSLYVTTHPQNQAMKALARKFNAGLRFENLEAAGMIDLTQRPAQGRKARALPRPPARPAPVAASAAEPDLAAAFSGLTKAVLDFQFAAMGGVRPDGAAGASKAMRALR
ncbi:GNAT family N-acetyltransferase [Nitratireductor sp. CAU 1489]|uniref:GNAT family N-acetyltransferase n=1 Tax=Nitratireductor arenosus TaxID=2682096 RepID=A0A844QFA6_9HYPH|nr:GNAT family N-acetyltransferase [Nitratireductor arenosus]MVA98042.1 GNAT family N-acetyltransferase [Nitratireductor arenosus]